MAQQKIVQDVIPRGKRTIRDIPLSRSSAKPPVRPPALPPKEPKKPVVSTSRPSSGKERNGILWTLVALSIFALVYALMSFFARATITVLPQQALVSLSETVTAERSGTTGVPFEVMTLSLAAEREIPATRKEEVAVKAGGMITIYNNYSTASQRLIKNTRFESADGKIYKIVDSVTVPGRTTKGSVVTPGSVDSMVYAESPGAEYNMKIADLKGDFTIPGFKGDPRYKSFYARLKTDIEGGLQGTVQKAEQPLYDATVAELRAQLEKDIVAKAYAEKPDDYILAKSSYWIEYKQNPDVSAGAEAIKVGVSAVMHGVIFPEERLAGYLFKQKAASAPLVEPLALVEGEGFNITVDAGKSTKPWENPLLKVTLSGDARLISNFDRTALVKAVAGISEKDFPAAIALQPGIQSAKLSIQPFGKTRIPDSIDKIKVLTE
jgi:hypothetical protein